MKILTDGEGMCLYAPSAPFFLAFSPHSISKCYSCIFICSVKSAFFFTFYMLIDGMVLSLVLSLSCWASCHNLWFLADGCSECFPEWKFHSGSSKAATLHRQPASWCNKYFYPYTCSVFLFYCFYYCGVWVCVPKCMKLTFPTSHT